MGMGRCCSLDWLVRQGDTPDEARIKTVLFPFFAFVFPFCVFVSYNEFKNANQTVYVIGAAVCALASALFLGGVVSNAIRPGYLADAVIVLFTVGVCALDLANATRLSAFRGWAFVVLVLDAALVFKRNHMLRFVIPFVL
eukprot:Hpha_TRINITY_DN15384_c3_g2::TRINITY_DN15384_c3_g2_i3::g.88063::m.88063